MWPYGVLWILGSITAILFTYRMVTRHLEHRKHMAEIKGMFVDLENERKKERTPYE
jgi:hypothetical protein